MSEKEPLEIKITKPHLLPGDYMGCGIYLVAILLYFVGKNLFSILGALEEIIELLKSL